MNIIEVGLMNTIRTAQAALDKQTITHLTPFSQGFITLDIDTRKKSMLSTRGLEGWSNRTDYICTYICRCQKCFTTKMQKCFVNTLHIVYMYSVT